MKQLSRTVFSRQTVIAAVFAACLFIIIYSAGAIRDANQRYQFAEAISTNRAHTRVGKEGYEYIFDPNTQIFIDKILPNREMINAHIVMHDYFPSYSGSGCEHLDVDICTWMRFNIFYPHDQNPIVIRLLISASTAAVLSFFLYKLLIALTRDGWRDIR